MKGGCLPQATFVSQTPHHTWSLWGLLLEIMCIKALHKLPLEPMAGVQGSKSRHLAVLPTVHARALPRVP